MLEFQIREKEARKATESRMREKNNQNGYILGPPEPSKRQKENEKLQRLIEH